MSLWVNSLLTVKVVKAIYLLIAILMFSRFLPKKSKYLSKLTLYGLFCLTLAVGIPMLSDSLLFVSSVFLTISFAVMLTVRVCYRADWSAVFFVGAAALSADHIASMLDSIVSLNFPEQFTLLNAEQFNPWAIVNEVACRFLVYALIDLLLIRRNQDIDSDSINFAPSLLILIISLVMNLYLNLLFSNLVDIKTYWVSFFAFLMNILISVMLLVCQYAMVRENRVRIRLQISDLLREQAKEQYEISRANINAINQKSHDLKHLLMAVKSVIDPKEYASIMDTINSYGAEIKTNNEVLDVVFQEKNFQCRKLGIQFTCIIDGSAVAFMETTDLYVLFGNLLDNCIEAVSKLPEGEVKNIQVTVRRDKGFVIITTENGYTGELQWKDGHPGTSKQDKSAHGFGILSIEKIAHKYGGRYSINTEDQIYCMNIVLPQQNIRKKTVIEQ